MLNISMWFSVDRKRMGGKSGSEIYCARTFSSRPRLANAVSLLELYARWGHWSIALPLTQDEMHETGQFNLFSWPPFVSGSEPRSRLKTVGNKIKKGYIAKHYPGKI